MTEYETKMLALTERIAKAVERGGSSTTRASGGGAVFGNYGRNKGGPVVGASIDDLMYYGEGCLKSLDNPEKERFHAKEQALLDAINAELVSRNQAPLGEEEDDRGPPPDDNPGPSDDDIPF